MSLKEDVLQLWRSRIFQITLDICRILMLIIVIFIAYKLVTEIEAVKLLNTDPCRVCMSKTGAFCFYPENILAIEEGKKEIEGIFNYTEAEGLIP